MIAAGQGLSAHAAAGQIVLDASGLPDHALAAAATFHARIVPRLREELGDPAAADAGVQLVVVFGSADHAHGGWRRVAVQALARQWAPARINAIAVQAGDWRLVQSAIAGTLAFLAEVPGITGQVLEVGGNFAELD